MDKQHVGDPNEQPLASGTNDLTFHVPGSYRYLAFVRDAATELALQQGFNIFDAGQFEMAVDEACTNVIEHSYGGACSLESEPDHPGISIRFIPLENGIAAEISDHGAGFDFQKDRIVDANEYIANRNERGLGLYIISQFVDDMCYEHSSETGNTMRLTKRL